MADHDADVLDELSVDQLDFGAVAGDVSVAARVHRRLAGVDRAQREVALLVALRAAVVAAAEEVALALGLDADVGFGDTLARLVDDAAGDERSDLQVVLALDVFAGLRHQLQIVEGDELRRRTL